MDRALGLLSLVASGGGAQVSMTELVAATGLSRPTVRRLMLALMRAGLVEQEAGSGYALGPEAQVLGVMAARRFDLVGAAQDSLIALSRESEDSSFVSLRRGSYSVCLHREEGAFPIRNLILQAGDRHPLGLGAGSMAILASLPEAEAAEILADTRPEVERSYPNFTQAWLGEELARARARGWSLNPGVRMASSWAIGVAVFDPAGVVVGSLSIAALDSRMGEDRQPEIVAMLKRESAAVTRRLAAQRKT
ncbi:IclR family transcriptional regulator [Salipiger pacificus]|uniref:IclR family transcriptional regulator n=1 Tax=Salipiger mangrovisoli TaxID=2865933 RepID=A0ABR9X5H7_9RHOB|nr:IclR family transcriptional regulator [Salipiger mangrovisoli]